MTFLIFKFPERLKPVEAVNDHQALADLPDLDGQLVEYCLIVLECVHHRIDVIHIQPDTWLKGVVRCQS